MAAFVRCSGKVAGLGQALQMTPSFGPNATINIFQNGNLVFSATIPIE